MSAVDLEVDEPVEVEEPARHGKRRNWSFSKPGEPRPERLPLTEEEWARVLGVRRHTVISLVTKEQREWAGNQAAECGNCKGVQIHGGRGWCVRTRALHQHQLPETVQDVRGPVSAAANAAGYRYMSRGRRPRVLVPQLGEVEALAKQLETVFNVKPERARELAAEQAAKRLQGRPG